jgi:gluconokinase
MTFAKMLSLNPLEINSYGPSSPLGDPTAAQAMVSSPRVVRPSMAPKSPVLSAKSASSTNASVSRSQAAEPHHIWLVTGPAGSGKTTVAEFIAKSLQYPYVEGDNVRFCTLLKSTCRRKWLT